jgi:hypothetical protein
MTVYGEYLKKFKSSYQKIYDKKVKVLQDKVRKNPSIDKTLLGVTKQFNENNIINSFKLLSGVQETSILLGVQGGILSEGIDYFGDYMEMVIIIGIPYPSSASEMRQNTIKKNYFKMLTGDSQLGEDLAYKHDSFRKIAQSIGRAHRKMKDRAVIICMDERLLAVKNTGDADVYEFLSPTNAKNNIKILQQPVRIIKNNVVLNQKATGDSISIRNYISSHLCSNRDFISSREMADKIARFYEK